MLNGELLNSVKTFIAGHNEVCSTKERCIYMGNCINVFHKDVSATMTSENFFDFYVTVRPA